MGYNVTVYSHAPAVSVTVLFAFAPWVRLYYHSTNTNPAGELKRSDTSAQLGICCHSTPRIWLASVRFLTMWDFTSSGSTFCWCWTTGEGKSWNSPPTNKTVPFWAKRRIGNKETGIFPRANQSTSESFARKGAPNKLPLSEPKKAKSVCHSATWVTVKQSLVKYALDGKTRCESGNLVSSQAG